MCTRGLCYKNINNHEKAYFWNMSMCTRKYSRRKSHQQNTCSQYSLCLSYHLLCVPKDGSIIFWNSFEVKSNRNIIKWKIAFLQNAEPQYHEQCITCWKCQNVIGTLGKITLFLQVLWGLSTLWPEVPHFAVLTW